MFSLSPSNLYLVRQSQATWDLYRQRQLLLF
jgi:hypothetical protein